MDFVKYQALGNDYLVVNPAALPKGSDPAHLARRLCDRHYGPGADGILVGPLPSPSGAFGLRIFNPDGSEAEKSGNGLRIFARALLDGGQVEEEEFFSVHTAGGEVRCRVHAGGRQATVEMGAASFDSARIPVAGPQREVVDEPLDLPGADFHYCAVTLGNPHCVVLDAAVSPELAQSWGPLIETLPCFPNRTNVQFLEILDPANLRIEIWERGAGYTLASGSSACAAAAAAYRLGRCEASVRVHMPGGALEVSISPGYQLTQTGPVELVYWGHVQASSAPNHAE